MIAALYVEADGCYANLEGVDPWDEKRDARLYPGPYPVVAHPPCARWSKLAPSVEARFPDRYRVGDDGGTFEAALKAVRLFGGVLEHPAESLAWAAYGLPYPHAGGWTRGLFDPGYVCEVAQSAYGHRAQKRTWLYYVGDDPPPPLRWSQPRGGLVVGQDSKRKIKSRGGVERMGHRERLATPLPFRDLLIDLARQAREGEE